MHYVAGVAIAGVAVARSRPAAMTWATIAAVLVASDVRVHCDGLAAGGFGRCQRGYALAVVDLFGRAAGVGLGYWPLHDERFAIRTERRWSRAARVAPWCNLNVRTSRTSDVRTVRGEGAGWRISTTTATRSYSLHC